jgi:hypothetical protein
MPDVRKKRPSVSALIHDDDTGCASGPSVLDFGLECAGPGSRTRAKISVGQVFIFAMFNPEVVPTEEGRLITRA